MASLGNDLGCSHLRRKDLPDELWLNVAEKLYDAGNDYLNRRASDVKPFSMTSRRMRALCVSYIFRSVAFYLPHAVDKLREISETNPSILGYIRDFQIRSGFWLYPPFLNMNDPSYGPSSTKPLLDLIQRIVDMGKSFVGELHTFDLAVAGRNKPWLDAIVPAEFSIFFQTARVITLAYYGLTKRQEAQLLRLLSKAQAARKLVLAINEQSDNPAGEVITLPDTLHELEIRTNVSLRLYSRYLVAFSDAACARGSLLRRLAIEARTLTTDSPISAPDEREARATMTRIAQSCTRLEELSLSGSFRCDGPFFHGLVCGRSIRRLTIAGIGMQVDTPGTQSRYNDFCSSVLDFAEGAPLLEMVDILHDYGCNQGRDNEVKRQLRGLEHVKKAYFGSYM